MKRYLKDRMFKSAMTALLLTLGQQTFAGAQSKDIRGLYYPGALGRTGSRKASVVFAGSDDGHLYCLDSSDGTLLWKFRGLPRGRKDRKLLGNRRLISLWPARGGPVLAGGILYFAAGLWPGDGIFVHALNARTGKVIWSNTRSHQIPNANMDHGVSHLAGITPQGYFALVNDKLVVPCGAQLPAFLDPRTGKLDKYTMGWGGRNGLAKGSWFVAGIDRYLMHSGDVYDISRENEEKFRDARGRPDFKNMLYTGRLIKADEALAIGLIDRIVEPPSIESETQALCEAICAGSQFTHRATKKIVRMILDGATEDTGDTLKLFDDAFQGEDYREGTRAFMEKRKPKFTWS